MSYLNSICSANATSVKVFLVDDPKPAREVGGHSQNQCVPICKILECWFWVGLASCHSGNCILCYDSTSQTFEGKIVMDEQLIIKGTILNFQVMP